jgi:hypothetical protein
VDGFSPTRVTIPQPGIRITCGLVDQWTALGTAVLPGHPAREAFTHPEQSLQVSDRRAPAFRV